MIISTLLPEETICAAKVFARDVARRDRAVVLSRAGATQPLFWLIPAGKELDKVAPDLVLVLIQNTFTASTKLLLATANHVVLITGSSPDDRNESEKWLKMIVQESSPNHVEVVVVAEGRLAARETRDHLAGMADRRFGSRMSWRHLPAQRLKDAMPHEEEGTMPATKLPPVQLSEAELRAKEWEKSFHRAEKLLQEAHEALRRHWAKSGTPMPPFPDQDAGKGARAV